MQNLNLLNIIEEWDFLPPQSLALPSCWVEMENVTILFFSLHIAAACVNNIASFYLFIAFFKISSECLETLKSMRPPQASSPQNTPSKRSSFDTALIYSSSALPPVACAAENSLPRKHFPCVKHRQDCSSTTTFSVANWIHSKPACILSCS